MLVNCVAYEAGRKLGDIARTEISEYLKRPGCFVWVALKDPEPAELLGGGVRHAWDCSEAVAGNSDLRPAYFRANIFTRRKTAGTVQPRGSRYGPRECYE